MISSGIDLSPEGNVLEVKQAIKSILHTPVVYMRPKGIKLVDKIKRILLEVVDVYTRNCRFEKNRRYGNFQKSSG